MKGAGGARRGTFLALAALAFHAAPAAAAPWWSDRTLAGHDLSNCPQSDVLPDAACLTIGCGFDGSFTLAVLHDEPGISPRADATLGFDGKPAFTATFTAPPSDRADNWWLAAAVPPEVMPALMDRLAAAATLSLRFDPASGLRAAALDPLALAGLGAPLARFRAACVDPVLAGGRAAGDPAAPPSALPPADPAATPVTDPARFPTTTSLAETGAEADGLARGLLASEIAGAEAGAGRKIEVMPELIRFADGRQLLLVMLCDPTWFGITGCETHLFTAAAPGAAFARGAEPWIGGGVYWLDLKLGAGGWPDILSQPHTGGGAYARMRWTGAGYGF